jgi:hypothetical protein
MTPVYLKRQHDMLADFVVYHRDHGPDCSIWMVPGTHVEIAGPRYRSSALAAAEPFSYARMHQREMEARRDAVRARMRGRSPTMIMEVGDE